MPFLLWILFLLSSMLQGQEDMLTSSHLPIFVINTHGEKIKDEPKIAAHLGIISNPDDINKVQDPFNHYDGNIGIEIRGNGTADLEKSSYLFETRNADGSNNNISLLNLPSENDWILYGPYLDKALLRNVLTFEIARSMGHYAPRTSFCEVIINKEYQGVYILMEKIKRDKDRVNIKKQEDNNKPDEGGYIIKIDSWWNPDLGWKGNSYQFGEDERQILYHYEYPKWDEINDEQKIYIQEKFDHLESLLNKEEIDLNVLTKQVDLNSFIDYLIINELAKNPDGYRLSTYLYKDASEIDSLIYIGPVWDYNYGYGNYPLYENKYENWEFDNHWLDYPSQVPFWWNHLFANEDFHSRLTTRWHTLRKGLLSCSNLEMLLSNWIALLGESIDRNYKKWPILGSNLEFDWNAGPLYEDEIDYLQSWLCNRMDWIDAQLPKAVPPNTEFSAKLFPNPALDYTLVSLNLEKETLVTLEIHDLAGRNHLSDQLVYAKGNNLYRINMIDLPRGFYEISLKRPDMPTKSLKLIKI